MRNRDTSLGEAVRKSWKLPLGLSLVTAIVSIPVLGPLGPIFFLPFLAIAALGVVFHVLNGIEAVFQDRDFMGFGYELVRAAVWSIIPLLVVIACLFVV